MLAIVVILGLIVGSFLNVCIWRLPRTESVVWPGSYCPDCGQALRASDLIPLLSFILSRGRCRYCGQSISWRYPVIEAIAAMILAYLYINTGWGWQLARDAILFYGLLVASAIDIEWHIIPNRLTAFMAAAGAVLILLSSPHLLLSSLGGAVSAALILLLPAILYPGGMGGGDIKLAAVIGLYLGWPTSLLAVFLGVLCGAAGGLIWMLLSKKDLKAALPFGPFLSVGAVAALLWGEQLVQWYTGFF